MSECDLYDSRMGATFSLSDLKRPSSQLPYFIRDGDIPNTVQIEQNYSYYFNVCGILSTGIPQACSDDPTLATSLTTASVLQVTDPLPNAACYVIGSYSDASSGISLLDQNDPTKGLQLTYYGPSCSSSVTNKRQVNIELSCADTLNPMPQSAYELSTCVYTIVMPSVYGCPLECPVSKRSLCGGAGYCGYDTSAQKARCFCNEGYSGADCLTSSNSKNSSNSVLSPGSPGLIGLIVALIVVVGVLIVGILYLTKRMKTYRGQIEHYQALINVSNISNSDASHSSIGSGVV